MYAVWFRLAPHREWLEIASGYAEKKMTQEIAATNERTLKLAGYPFAQAEVREVEAPKRLPTIEEIGGSDPGSDPDFTGGLSSEEYVRRMRDEREERLYGAPTVSEHAKALNEAQRCAVCGKRFSGPYYQTDRCKHETLGDLCGQCFLTTTTMLPAVEVGPMASGETPPGGYWNANASAASSVPSRMVPSAAIACQQCGKPDAALLQMGPFGVKQLCKSCAAKHP